MLIKLFGSVNTDPDTFFAILQISSPSDNRLDIVQNLGYKFVELVYLTMGTLREEQVKDIVSYRFNLLKMKNNQLMAKYKNMFSLVKVKNPSLAIQIQKNSNGKNTGSANTLKHWRSP